MMMLMDKTIQLQQVRNLVARDMLWKEYHNPQHAYDVSKTAGRIARELGLDSQLVHLVETAGLIHDVIHVTGASDNEERSAMYGRQQLGGIGYTEKQIAIISDMITRGTKQPHRPENILERILADADLHSAGRDEFFVYNERLRNELGLPADRTWYERSLRFLEEVQWYTAPARRQGEAIRKRNIERLHKLLEYEV
jgi:predicted metal-dependent HD superfamily phosphohydrolase